MFQVPLFDLKFLEELAASCRNFKSAALVRMRQAPDLLHTFWTVLAPPFKSGAQDSLSAALSWTFRRDGTK
jgi:hypothetical protein